MPLLELPPMPLLELPVLPVPLELPGPGGPLLRVARTFTRAPGISPLASMSSPLLRTARLPRAALSAVDPLMPPRICPLVSRAAPPVQPRPKALPVQLPSLLPRPATRVSPIIPPR